MRASLCIDLFCGLGGWTDGFLSAGWNVVGFDIERHTYGDQKYPAQLVLQDVMTIQGSQFRNADIIVASPPCQNYSYLAMPWSRSTDPNNSKKAKALRKKWETEGPDNRLFDACFRIQREAIEATRTDCRECGVARCLTEIQRCESQLMAGEYPAEMEGLLLGLHDWTCELRLLCEAGCANCHGEGSTTRYIPLIVENVRGAIPWVGPSKANYGSFHLWGDVEMVGNRIFVADEWKRGGAGLRVLGRAPKVGGYDGNGSWTVGGKDWRDPSVIGQKRNPDGTGHPTGSWFRIADSSQGDRGQKGKGGMWFGPVDKRGDPRAAELNSDGTRDMPDGTKIGGDWLSDPNSTCRKHGSRSNARKAASAMIAKIPLPLSSHVARVLKPAIVTSEVSAA